MNGFARHARYGLIICGRVGKNVPVDDAWYVEWSRNRLFWVSVEIDAETGDVGLVEEKHWGDWVPHDAWEGALPSINGKATFDA